MPDYDDENYPLTSSKKFSSIRLRRSGISSKRKSELKATISGPYTFDGGGLSAAALGDAPLRTLNGTGSLHSNSASTNLSGLSPPPQTFTRGVRRNSDIPLRRHHSSLAWPSNRPAITPIHGSPHRPTRATSRRSTQVNRGPRWSGTIATGILKGDLDKVTSQQPSLSDKLVRDLNLLDVASDEFDPRTMMESLPALNLGLTSAASFGSVKQRTRRIDKTLRTSRITLLSAPEKANPGLVYTDDSDTFSSPPSTPSTPVWETTPTSSMPKADPILSNKLELADVHAQIQAMIDSANRPLPTESGDNPRQDQEPPNIQRNDIPLSLRPRNPMHTSFPPFATAHRRSASSPPLGSGIYRTYPPDLRDRSLFQPITPVVLHKPAPPAPLSPKTTPASPASAGPADLTTPSTPTKKPSSERSDSPSVYSQQSPSSQTHDVTPTSSNTSSPDHPYAKNKHERLLAAISEGISSPTKPGSVTSSILGSGHGRAGNLDLTGSPLGTRNPAVPMIVVTDPNDDDLVYSESSFSIVDMYAGSAESPESGPRRRTRTAISVSDTPLQVPDAC